MSLYRSIGLTIELKSPLFGSAETLDPIDKSVTGYTHTIAADGGYQSADIQLVVSRYEIEDWLDNGLGRDIKAVIDHEVIFHGFVNTIRATMSGFSVARGPLMDVANRVLVVYTPYSDITVDPPQRGDPTETTISEDADSQALYGIQEEIISGGTLIDAATYGGSGDEAVELRDAYLAEYKYPETSQELAAGSAGELSLALECRGYYDWFDRYVYNNSGTGYITLPAKIEAILGADPNSIFSADYSHINDAAAFLLPVIDAENDNKKAQSIIGEMVALGNGSDNRTTFAIYDDLIAYYDAIPTEVAYEHRLVQKKPHVEDIQGSEVQPWSMRPAKWLRVADFMIGRHTPSALRLDPRIMFIESVRYTAPFGLQLTGSKVSTVKQLMAKRGFSL